MFFCNSTIITMKNDPQPSMKAGSSFRLQRLLAGASAKPLALLLALATSAFTVNATLLLHYTFDEASGPALDTSGVAPTANGTFTANAARTAEGSTPLGTGYALNLTGNGAVNNWVGVTAANGGSKLDTMQSFTLTTWVNMRSSPANTDRLLGRLGPNPFPGFDFMVGTPNSGTLGAGNFKLAMAVDSSTAIASTADTGADGIWRFVALTYDGSLTADNVRFYTGSTIEAVAQLGNTVTRNAGAVNTTATEFRVGGTTATTADRTPPAWLDDVRVYDTVLSPQELEAVRQVSVVPEPGTATLLGLALLGTLSRLGRRRQATAIGSSNPNCIRP